MDVENWVEQLPIPALVMKRRRWSSLPPPPPLLAMEALLLVPQNLSETQKSLWNKMMPRSPIRQFRACS